MMQSDSLAVSGNLGLQSNRNLKSHLLLSFSIPPLNIGKKNENSWLLLDVVLLKMKGRKRKMMAKMSPLVEN